MTSKPTRTKIIDNLYLELKFSRSINLQPQLTFIDRSNSDTELYTCHIVVCCRMSRKVKLSIQSCACSCHLSLRNLLYSHYWEVDLLPLSSRGASSAFSEMIHRQPSSRNHCPIGPPTDKSIFSEAFFFKQAPLLTCLEHQ